jgi:anthranilate synthase component 2
LPAALIATAIDENGDIMSLKHREYDVRAVQYHPESILTEHGREILKNWIEA